MKASQRGRIKLKNLICAVLTIALTFVLFAPISALATQRIDIDYDWNNPCCDGGNCCILNACSCPMCYNRAVPGNECPDCGSDCCPDCGNCYECGTSPCPNCRAQKDPKICPECSGPLCNACWGCPECGEGRDNNCPYCSHLFEEPVDEIDTPSPLLTIGSVDIYLFAPAGISAWSLFNVLATVAGITVLAWTVVKAIIQKKQEEDAEMHSYMLQEVDAADNEKLTRIIAGKERYNTRRRLWSLTTSFACTVCAAVLALTSQDFRGIVTIFDRWIAIHAILLTGAIVFSILSFRRYEDEII